MRKNLTLATLSTIGKKYIARDNLFETILTSGYGAPSSHSVITSQRIGNPYSPASQHILAARENKKRCRALIQKLTSKAFIEHTIKKNKHCFHLTAKGMHYLARMREKQSLQETPATARAENARWIIIAFDIPEKKRSQRDWIRKTLATMGFSMIQKSVWMGRAVLPDAFVNQIARRDISSCVEILEIAKEGNVHRHVLSLKNNGAHRAITHRIIALTTTPQPFYRFN